MTTLALRQLLYLGLQDARQLLFIAIPRALRRVCCIILAAGVQLLFLVLSLTLIWTMASVAASILF